MKLFSLGLVMFALCSVSTNADINTCTFIQNASDSDHNFNLRYIFIGFGSNMFEMQPGFTVSGRKFLYTSEEVWGNPDEKRQVDTLTIGCLRKSSIDSIIELVNPIQDTLIRTSSRVMGGGIAELNISYKVKKLRFSLFNTGDTTASKIAAILNTYISNDNQKLIIPDFNLVKRKPGEHSKP